MASQRFVTLSSALRCGPIFPPQWRNPTHLRSHSISSQKMPPGTRLLILLATLLLLLSSPVSAAEKAKGKKKSAGGGAAGGNEASQFWQFEQQGSKLCLRYSARGLFWAPCQAQGRDLRELERGSLWDERMTDHRNFTVEHDLQNRADPNQHFKHWPSGQILPKYLNNGSTYLMGTGAAIAPSQRARRQSEAVLTPSPCSPSCRGGLCLHAK